MQCVNCGFQNMPSSQVCGRCNTSLGIATAVMDVRPPRAGAMTKRLRRILPIRRALYRTVDTLTSDATSGRVRYIAENFPPFPIFVRLIFPGWSHFYLKQPVRGALFAIGFVACLIPSLWTFGTWESSIWFGLAFSVHSSAALDIVTQTFADAGMRDRMARSIGVSLVLGVCLYLPVVLLVSAVANPRTIMANNGAFQYGDVILVNRWANLRPGDIVVYTMQYEHDAGRIGYHHTIMEFHGENVDRILAIGGDRVQCIKGVLYVNDLVASNLPLNMHKFPDKLDWTVPADRYFILPSGPARIVMDNSDLWQTAANVSREDIAGRAYMQIAPHYHLIH
jgi:signal peptidase I